MTILTWLSIYFWCASIISFAALIAVPTRMKPLHNFMGSLMVGVSLGWLMWPIFVLVAIRTTSLPPKTDELDETA